VAGNGIADEVIEIHVQTQQIRDTAAESKPVVSYEIVRVNGLEGRLEVDDQINQHEECERGRISRDFERSPGCHVAGDDHNGCTSPRMLDQLNHFEQVCLHAS
jgi:hypothetical protein